MRAGWNLRPSRAELAVYCLASAVIGYAAGVASAVILDRSTR